MDPHDVLLNAPVSVLTLNAAGVITGWNLAAARLFGYRCEQALGCALEEATGLPAREIWDQGRSGGNAPVEYRALPCGGDPVQVLVTVQMQHAHAEPGEASDCILAVTPAPNTQPGGPPDDRQRGYQVMAESMSDLVSVHDLEGRFLFVSPSFERVAGYSADSLSGGDLVSLAHSDDRERIRQRVERVTATALPARLEWRRSLPDGAHRWVETLWYPILDEGGRPIQVVCTSRDITDRRLAVNALRKTNKRLSNVLESINEAYFVVDRDWQFAYVNPRGLALAKRSREQILGKKIWEVFLTVRATRAFEVLERAMFKQVADTIEEYIPRAGIWLRVQVHPSQDGLSVYVQDITEERRAKEGLQQSMARLKRSVTGIAGAMAMAVEIRDPYTAGHQRRVAALAAAIARRYGMGATAVENLRMAGLLHDLGKIAIPAEILCKPGRLTDPEISIIRTHAQVGYDILKGIEFEGPIALVALQHHERLDGSGYPNGLTGEKVVTEARLMAIADVVEAMASHRPYRPSLGIEAALENIKAGRGRLFDSAGVDACLAVLGDFSYDLELLIERETAQEEGS